MKNKNWLIRSKTAKGVKNVTACQSLKGQDQYALFRNGELVRGVGNLEDTIDKFLRFEECDYCEENNDEGDDGDGG